MQANLSTADLTTIYYALKGAVEAIDSDMELMGDEDADLELEHIRTLMAWIAPMIGLEGGA